MYLIYSALLMAALVLGIPYWLWQGFRRTRYWSGLGERLGRVPQRIRELDTRPLIWVHAVSVGEVLAVAGLVQQLRARFPGYRVLISTTTVSGQTLAAKRFGQEKVFFFPLDLPFAVRAYLRALNPRLIVVAETEFWPNFLRLAKSSGATIAVVNARISDRSLPGYRRFRALLAAVLQNVDLFLAQTENDAHRLVEIGAPADRVQTAGNVKFDIPPPAEIAIVTQLRSALSKAAPIIVCGSTMDGEEPLLLRAFINILASHPQAFLILAPRHPERFDKVDALIAQLGIPRWRRSRWSGEPIQGGVLLLDSIGELASIYSLAQIAFVGGSLVARGGHNILEPAQFGVATVTGVSYENFRDIVDLFRVQDAVRIAGPAELPLLLLDLANQPDECAALGQRALKVLQGQTGATERTLEALATLLKSRSAAS